MMATIGNRPYYLTTMALSEIPRFFKFTNWEDADPALRAQRVLNTARIPEITRYILENEDGYIFSSITASYNCPVLFTPLSFETTMGHIEMDLETMEFVINDGQHRCAAIAAALQENPSLGKHRISVLLFPSEGLERMQQMFSDLNRFVHKTSKSLNILYDHRDSVSSLTMEVAEEVFVFQGMLEKERTSMPLRSSKLLTLSALYDANVELLGKVGLPDTTDYQSKKETAIRFWNQLAAVIPDWAAVKAGHLQAPRLRQEKISTHTVVLRALGAMGNTLVHQYPDLWVERLETVRKIDWRKSTGNKVNPLWDNVCIVAASVVSNRQARMATQAVLKHLLDLELSKQEAQIMFDLKSAGWKSAK